MFQNNKIPSQFHAVGTCRCEKDQIVVVKWLTLLLKIWEVLGSKLEDWLF
jgi:hypothetical protein